MFRGWLVCSHGLDDSTRLVGSHLKGLDDSTRLVGSHLKGLDDSTRLVGSHLKGLDDSTRLVGSHLKGLDDSTRLVGSHLKGLDDSTRLVGSHLKGLDDSTRLVGSHLKGILCTSPDPGRPGIWTYTPLWAHDVGFLTLDLKLDTPPPTFSLRVDLNWTPPPLKNPASAPALPPLQLMLCQLYTCT